MNNNRTSSQNNSTALSAEIHNEYIELLEALKNIRSTLLIQERRGNPDATFLLKRL